MRRSKGGISVVAALSFVLLAACAGQPTAPDDGSEQEGSILFLEVHPSRAVIQANDTIAFDAEIVVSDDFEASPVLEWTASGGTITSQGMFVAGRHAGKIDVTVKARGRGHDKKEKKAHAEVLVVEDEPQPASLHVVPGRTAVHTSDTTRFEAVVLDDEGFQMNALVEWSATGGSVDPAGLFTASAEAGAFRVTASGPSNLTGSAFVDVTNEPSEPADLTISPASVELDVGSELQFEAVAWDQYGDPIGSTVQWSATGGEIGPEGRYTAGTAGGQYAVTASGPDGLSATAVVQILEEEPVATSLEVSPDSARLTSGEVQGFTSTVLDQRGEPMSMEPGWTALGGEINAGGFYTAGAVTGTYPVVATLSAGLTDTAWVTVAAPPPPPDPSDLQPVGPTGDWQLILSEEFDGNNLNTGVWTPNFLWWPDPINNELGFYDPSNAEVSDGHLHLTAEEVPQRGMPYSTSAISSHGKFVFRYGTVEMRAKFPAGNGFHIAFWTVLEGGPWPPEIDIVEHLGEDATLLFHTLHYTDSGHQVDYSWWRGPDFTAGFHTYTMTWKPDRIEWYVDGVLRHTVSEQQIIPQQDMYLLANLAVGGNWPVPPDATTPFPSSWDIDYIRVWQE